MENTELFGYFLVLADWGGGGGGGGGGVHIIRAHFQGRGFNISMDGDCVLA